MRDRNFYINSIKMDLFRVVTATGDVTKPAAKESAQQFLQHALEDFEKFENNEKDLDLKAELQQLEKELFKLDDPQHRLRWTERVLTTRCRFV